MSRNACITKLWTGNFIRFRTGQFLRQAEDKNDVSFWLKPTATADMMVTMLEHIEA